MKRIIANADDFGRHELINRAVELGVTKGCLRSATVMPGGTAFEGAIQIAKRYPQLGLGVHFTLVNGNPILPPEQIPTLVGENGKFREDYLHFVKSYLQGQVSLKEVRAELTAQLDKVASTGVHLTHIDSHQHMHTLPGIVDIALELAGKAGIRAARMPKAPIFTDGLFSTGLGQLIGRTGLTALAYWGDFKAHSKGFRVPEHFAGIVAGEAVNEEHLAGIISRLQQGTTEIMLHPGTDSAKLQRDCLWEHDFEAELGAITSPVVLELLRKNGIAIGNFGDL